MVVLVNAMIPKPGETPGEWWSNTGHREAKRQQNVRDGRRADAPFDPLIDFFHDVPQAVVDKAWAQGEPRQSDTVFGSPCTFKAWPDVPTHVLVGSDDRFFPTAGGARASRNVSGRDARRTSHRPKSTGGSIDTTNCLRCDEAPRLTWPILRILRRFLYRL